MKAGSSKNLQMPLYSYQTEQRLSIPNFTAERSISAGLYKIKYNINQPIFTKARGSNCLQLSTDSYQASRWLSIPHFTAIRSIKAGLYKKYNTI